jgi:repressor LexA
VTETNLLTSRQAEVLAFLEERQRSTGFSPSLKEIARHFGFASTFAVREHLRLIEKKGFLRRVPRKSRAIRITRHCQGQENSLRRIPLLGRIPAGSPLTAVEETEEIIGVERRLFQGQQLYALRVRGNSMTGAGIMDGDLAVLNYQQDVENGQIAAVLIDDEATLKRVFRTPDALILHPENPDFQNIVITDKDTQECRIAGRLVGLIRSL